MFGGDPDMLFCLDVRAIENDKVPDLKIFQEAEDLDPERQRIKVFLTRSQGASPRPDF